LEFADVPDGSTSMLVRLTYQDGTTEDHALVKGPDATAPIVMALTAEMP